jgi:hypothetical protein
MRNRVESLEAVFQKYEEDCDVVALMKAIRECAFNSNEKQYPPRQAAMALKQLMMMHQQEDETLVGYYKRFVEICKRVERMYGDVIPGVIASKDTGKEKKEVKELNAKNRMLAILFMEGGNRGFKPLLRDLENDFALGASLYPGTPAEALQVMLVYETSPIYKAITKKLRKKKESLDDDGNQEYSFVNKGEMMKKGLCFKCGRKGTRLLIVLLMVQRRMMMQRRKKEISIMSVGANPLSDMPRILLEYSVQRSVLEGHRA